MSDDLLIKINADAENVKAEYAKIRDQTEELEEGLAGLAKISAVAFAALTAQVALSVNEFVEADTASRKLSNTLQNQGIFTEQLRDSYLGYAEAISRATGLQDEEIVKAQVVAQGFLGQIPITEELTKAIADLSVQQGISLPAAAEALGKAISNGNGMLIKQGLAFSETSTTAERYQQTLEFVSVKAGDAATNINPLELASKRLSVAFSENAEDLGARFAPALAIAADALASFLNPVEKGSGFLTDMKAALIAIGLAISGAAVALTVGGQAVLVFRAALLALNIQLTATQLLLTALGVGAVLALVAGIVLLATHWKEASAVIVNVTRGMIEFVSGAFKGLGAVLVGAFTLDPAKIKEGLLQIQNAFKEGVATATKEIPKETEKALTEQDKVKKKFADQQAARQAEENATRLALERAQNEAVQLEIEGASDKLIQLKKEEIAVLQELSNEKSSKDKALLRERLAELQELEASAREEDTAARLEFEETVIAAKEEFGDRISETNQKLSLKEQADIRKNSLTEATAQRKVYTDKLKEQQAANNRYLQEQVRYGTAYAAINRAIHSNEVQGIKSATSDLAQLTQSKNETLKRIGKVAAIASIIIKTAESAMNIFAGFSTIPIIGPPLGVAGAAAAIAFGAEQVATVSAAQTGGLVGGQGFGDTQPFLLEPGELITPRQNFNEVVESVARSRGLSEPGQVEGQEMGLAIGFDGRQAQQVITARQVEAKSLGVLRQRT